MSLDLTKYRLANHERIAVGGSYSDTFLEVMANSGTSSNLFGYLRWVPNDKSGTLSNYYGGGASIDDSYFEDFGYLQWTMTGSNPWNLWIFTHYDDTATYDGSNTSPGIRLISHSSYSANGVDLLAADINAIHGGEHGTNVIYVIANNGRIRSSSALYSSLNTYGKSWRWVKFVGSNTTITDRTFCAIGTNINNIGFLAENLAGPTSNHIAAFSEIVVEHDRPTLGHAGYGEDLSSGFGSGTSKIDMADGTYDYTVNWNNNGRFRVHPGENVRLTYETRIGQGAKKWNGYITVKTEEISVGGSVGSTTSNTHQVVDGFAKGELTHTKVTDSNPTFKMYITASGGSGTGVGFDTCDLKNLQAFKCGYSPDAQRDVAIHKYHVNALNVEESPGPFRIGEPNEFYSFWQSDRNLAGTSTLYYLNTANSSTVSSPIRRPINRQYQNTSSTAWTDPQGYYNYPEWFNKVYQDTADSATWGWVHEVYNSTANSTKNVIIGPGGGTEVDNTKVYLAGVWMRVRRNAPTNEGVAPNRISLIGNSLHSAGYPESNYGMGTSLLSNNTNYLQSIGLNSYPNLVTNTQQEWKLLNGFYLPSWMTSSERTDWKENYWAQWANEFEHGEGTDTSKSISGLTGYGINTSNAGYVCGMTTNTGKIYPTVRVEQYTGTDLWVEFVHPFIIEIDPMNLDDEGNLWFWDFTENLPQ